MVQHFQAIQLDIEEVRRYPPAEGSGSCASWEQPNNASREASQEATQAMEARNGYSSRLRGVTACFLCGLHGRMACDCCDWRLMNSHGVMQRNWLSLHSKGKAEPIKRPTILVGIGQ
ncbi:hypothetical protein M514_02442 [Trichuris suis]|uniref:Uncharacterized protein n=1 Tax=Trichuris suis TaxID=68888 RepID=A0A085MHR9_9BILA|nr:hypothetical protein M513_02442 [Trichuris suis]KFD64779.1 hypothetical protein M514_02442 [Trichuris suis]